MRTSVTRLFHNTTLDLQEQEQDQDRFFWSQAGLVLRPTVSDHITVKQLFNNSEQTKRLPSFHAGI